MVYRLALAFPVGRRCICTIVAPHRMRRRSQNQNQPAPAEQPEEDDGSSSEDEVDLSDSDSDEEEEVIDLTHQPSAAQLLRKTPSAFCSELVLDLCHQRKFAAGGRGGRRKIPIRHVLEYCQTEIANAGKKIAIAVNSEEHMLPWSDVFDEMKLCSSSKKAYWGYMDNLIRFCLLLGCYEAVIILLPKAPRNTPSVDVDILKSFCEFKYGDSDQLLLFKGSPVRNIAGEQVRCSGNRWNTLDNIGRFAAAISGCHESRDQAGGYRERCAACYTKFSAWNFASDVIPQGCIHHSSTPKFFNSENPCSSCTSWKNYRKIKTNALKEVEKSQSSVLNPEELVLVIRFCLSQHTLWGLQLALMISVSVQLYLRNNEMKNICDRFAMELISYHA